MLRARFVVCLHLVCDGDSAHTLTFLTSSQTTGSDGGHVEQLQSRQQDIEDVDHNLRTADQLWHLQVILEPVNCQLWLR